MKVLTLIFPFAILLWVVICFCVWGKIFNKFFKLSIILFLSCIIFLFFSKPKNYGNWNLISKIEGEKILSVTISPSEPNYDVNLVKQKITIENNSTIDSITKILDQCYYVQLNHLNRIWEASLILNTKNHIIKFKIWEEFSSFIIFTF